MTGLVGRLPQLYQDQAAQLLDRPQPGQPDLGPSPGKLGRSNGAGQPAARTRPRYCTAAVLHLTTLTCSPGRARLGEDSDNLNTDEVNKSLRLTANAIQNYSFDKVGHRSAGGPVQLTVQSTPSHNALQVDKMSDISLPNCDLADEKDSGISQVSADGVGLEEKLALLELGERPSNGRGPRGVQGLEDMLYGGAETNSGTLGLSTSQLRRIVRGWRYY